MDKLFSEWLQEQLAERGWTQAELARSSGLTKQAISKYINQERTSPEPEALAAIALAFKLPVETLYRAAGLLPAPMDLTPTVEMAQHLMSQLPLALQEEILANIEFHHHRWEKEKTAQIEPARKKPKTGPLPQTP